MTPEQQALIQEARNRLSSNTSDLIKQAREKLNPKPPEQPEFLQRILEQKPLTTFGSEIEGLLTRQLFRGIEAASEIPGDISSLLENLGIPEAIAKTPLEQLTGFEFPTSGQFREREKAVFGKQFEPKYQGEEFAGEITQDFVRNSLNRFDPLKNFYTSVGGNLVKQGLIHGFDIDQGTADLAKIPIYMWAAGSSGKSKKEFVDDAWAKSDELFSNQVVTNDTLISQIKNYKHKLARGGLSPQEKLVLEIIDDFLPRIESGTFEFSELPEHNKVINKTYRQNYKLDAEGRKLLGNYQEIIHNGVKELANPEQLQAWNEATLASKALGAQNSLVRAATNVFKKVKLDPITKSILTFTYAKAASGVAATLLAKDRLSLLQRIMVNPEARKYYIQAIGGLLTNQSKLAISNAQKLDDIVKRMQSIGVENII